MEKKNEIKIGNITYKIERSFDAKKKLTDLLVGRIVSEKKKEDAKKAPNIEETA